VTFLPVSTAASRLVSFLLPESARLIYAFWAAVFLLIALLIGMQRNELGNKADIFAGFVRSDVRWVLGTNVDHRLGAAHFRSELLGLAIQYFGNGKVPEHYIRLVDSVVDEIQTGTFTERSGAELASHIRAAYISYWESHNETLRKSGFYYFYLLILLVLTYQLFVNIVYSVLRTSASSDQDTSAFLAEGAFNAIDLTILAGLTSMYFDAEWLKLSALIFLSYLAHMLLFGTFLGMITDRRTKAALSAYFASVLMTVVMAAVGIESLQYLLTGMSTILLCVLIAYLTVRHILPHVGGVGRFAPYMPGPSAVQQSSRAQGMSS
jgi:hypothetical protein